MNNTSRLNQFIFYVVLSFGAFIMFVPFYWMIATSLKTGESVMQIPPQWIPNPLTWEFYVTAWTKVDFARYTFNSVLISVLSVVGVMLSSAIVGFGLAMFNFKLRKPIYLAMISTLILPAQVTLIPTYFIWKNLHAFDTFFPLLVPGFLGEAFGIFLMHQFFKSLSKELFEAAIVDGYNPWGVLWRIYMPLSKPALSALAVFTFISSWGNTLGPLLYLQSRSMYTLSLGLLYLKSGDVLTDTPIVMAGVVMTTIPIVMVFLFAQKHFIQGLATTGIKG